ncbi:TetR family transcriptional regulator [Nonomuraea fuscirosea]|uniref:TetR family transcriptional regulator n=1 Tax=Nonomuraea fuscirosea TaxID=1291556 RepID=A0A2T0N2L2_9ACTN|nr:TetR/AcrR family transcriptional regulator [Nonomuraea fuscirosea]PRX66214.1 TetR family transcriptional regulator [Nonomuraea fuscirosea]
MGRTSDAKERILSAAQTLIELRGYSALGVAEICKAAGVPKGSFYYFFASKEDLALAVIDAHWAVQRDDWGRILGAGDPPLQRLRRLFEATQAVQHAGQQSCGTVSGCLFGNLTLEMSNQTEALRVRLQQIFDAQADLVEEVVTEARERGEVTVADTREAARSVVAQLEGQVLFAKLYNDTGRLDALWTNCLAILGATASGAASATASDTVNAAASGTGSAAAVTAPEPEGVPAR